MIIITALGVILILGLMFSPQDKEEYCKMFHTSYGTKDNKWYCKKCNITHNKKLSDDDCGPM